MVALADGAGAWATLGCVNELRPLSSHKTPFARALLMRYDTNAAQAPSMNKASASSTESSRLEAAPQVGASSRAHQTHRIADLAAPCGRGPINQCLLLT